MSSPYIVSRRRVLLSSGGIGAMTLLAACSGGSPASPTAPAASSASSAAQPTAAAGTSSSSSSSASAAPTSAPAAASNPSTSTSSQPQTAASSGAPNVKQVPRNRTLILGITGNSLTDYNQINPFLTGTSTSTGFELCYEPLYYYNAYHTDSVCGPPGSACKDGEVPWLATDYKYNDDFTGILVHLRDGVTWSDGQPFTANDVVFTINMLKEHAPKLTWSIDLKQWIKEATAPNEHTVQITLNNPNPRFFFSYFQFHEDIGFQIVPEHIWKDIDPTTFSNLDLAKGYPVTTGPWKMVFSSPQQRIWDRRDDWWAAKTGFHPLPKVERIIHIPGTDETKMVEMAVANEADETIDLRPNNIKAVIARNPKVIPWPGRNPPYGYLDWWPVSLGFNDSQAPYNDPDIRWAINYAIDRDQLVKIGYQGAGSTTLLPFPNFPALLDWLNKIDIKQLLQTYPIGTFDLKKSAQLMESKGYAKNQKGFWAKDGKQFDMVIQISLLFQDITPVLVAQLRKAGFNASFKLPQNLGTLESTGQLDAFIGGHGGSVRDPYFTLRLYQSRFSAPTGQAATYPYRWKDDNFDKIVDQMGTLGEDDPKMVTLFRSAMEIWMKALPDVGLVQWYHRIPTNYTYWKGWPDSKNPYINTAYWHRTAPMWINTIEPAQ